MADRFLEQAEGDLTYLVDQENGERTIKHYSTRLIVYRKISWFVSVWQINYLPQPSASANSWSARHRQITIFCDKRSTMSRRSIICRSHRLSARHRQITIFCDKRLTELNNVLSFGHRSLDHQNCKLGNFTLLFCRGWHGLIHKCVALFCSTSLNNF